MAKNDDANLEHYTAENQGKVGTISTEEEALAAHHLATADPERDGTMTGPAHEEKYGLERAPESAAALRAVGVHPIENRGLRPGEEGHENVRGASAPVETTAAASPADNTAAPRPR